MTCEACTEAASAVTHLYCSGCEQCTVRAIAGGPDFFHSAKAGELLPEYRDLLRRVYGSVWQDAHARIKAEADRMAKLAHPQRSA